MSCANIIVHRSADKVVSELIRKNEEVRMAIINLVCASPYVRTQM